MYLVFDIIILLLLHFNVLYILLLGYHNSTQASWGSNVVLVDGVYHMFAAQFANSCPLGQWGSTSMIIRAESSSPMGPFVYKETVVPVFSHNPTIRSA